MSSLPLSGRHVLVTRAAHQAGKLSEALRAMGAEPVEVPVLEIQPPASYEPLDRALRQLGRYDWLILTSANSVRAITERAAVLNISLKREFAGQVAAIGDATATATRKAGLSAPLVPDAYVAESLLKDLAGLAAGRRFLLARAAVARDVIPDALKAAGAHVDVVEAYRNGMPAGTPGLLREALSAGVDAVTFTSSSSVTHLADAARVAEIVFPFAGVAAISIGPITSKTLRELGWEPETEANPSNVPGLVAATVYALESHARR